jgi:tRNA 2-thiocytidine biosynthesis protein TtcA
MKPTIKPTEPPTAALLKKAEKTTNINNRSGIAPLYCIRGKRVVCNIKATKKEKTTRKFELHAITVDLGFGNSLVQIRDFCRQIDVSWSQVHTKIAPIVFEHRKEPNPCSLCSKMRNGALHITAKEMGCSKVALAHNLDDAIETFFLCLFYERRIKLMQPVSYLSRRKITLIRPLIYVREISIIHSTDYFQLPVVKNPCPEDSHTKREEMKQLVSNLEKRFPGVRDKLLTAFRNSNPDYLWKMP